MGGIVTIKNRPTSCRFHSPSIEKESNDPVLVLIPGNPGLVGFYTGYLEAIQEQFPRFEILCNSHAGYNTQRQQDGLSGPFQFFDLEYQMNFHYEILRDLINEKEAKNKNEPVRLYFLSHSCGSFIVQKVIRKLLEDKALKGKFEVKFVGLICPTIIDIAQSESGILFGKLFKYLPIVSVLVLFARIVNLFLNENNAKKVVAKVAVAKPKLKDKRSIQSWENAVDSCYSIVRDEYIVRHSMELARNELDTILRDDSFNDWFFEDFPLHGTKIWTFFALKDHWVHDNSRDYILSRYNKSSNKNIYFSIDTSEAPISHSFCVAQTVEFAELTCETLTRLFPNGV